MSLFEKPQENFYTKEYLEWMAILKATDSNPTLKELADQLRVLYNASKEPEPQPVFQEDIWQGTVTADDSYEMIFEPTETGVWRGLVLG